MSIIHSQTKAWQPHIITIHHFDRRLLLTGRQIYQGLLVIMLTPLLRKFYGCHHNLVNRYGIPLSQMTTDE